MPTSLELVATIFFALAIVHTFLVSKIEEIADQKIQGSLSARILHMLSEVELVFALWGIIFLAFYCILAGPSTAFSFATSLNFTEPLFVFVIMTVAATKPIISLATSIIKLFARPLPFSERMSFYISALVVGPILGSLITEPAAMTVTALILLKMFFIKSDSMPFKYATLALLFVNVSIGGTLTNFAAPPVLMVASVWKWDSLFMLGHFGLKALTAIIISTAIYAYSFRSHLTGKIEKENSDSTALETPWWLKLLHSIILFLVVMNAHYPNVFLLALLLFLMIYYQTRKYQDSLKAKSALLVGLFLAGLIVLGSLQAWWLRPLLANAGDEVLLFGATLLTSITDNAALTYLGSLVDLSDSAKYFLVAGAVSGGGLTVIANAPNPAGYGILNDSFGESGINPFHLLMYALIPTAIAVLCFYLLPSLNFN